MHLIAPICAGIAGAQNGTVDIYVRGTSTRATTYATFEGGGSATPTGALTLDANGGRVIYVDDFVDCVVKDSTGTTVRSFTAGAKDAAVEVISPSFTGVSYTTGITAANSPTDLQTVLGMAVTSFGTTNWNVLLTSGSTTTVQSALSMVGEMYFNVKDPTYGAKGDTSTDDAAAIQAALTAAGAAAPMNAATVFFPPGVYTCESALSVPYGVNLLGAGSQASTLQIRHATYDLLDYDDEDTPSASMVVHTIKGLGLSHQIAGTGSLIDITQPCKVSIQDCSLGNPNYDYGKLVNCATTTALNAAVIANNTFFAVGSSTANCIYLTYAPLYAHGCGFVPFATGNSGYYVVDAQYGCDLTACWFANGVVASGTLQDLNVNGDCSPNSIVGCNFPDGAGAAIYAIRGNTSSDNVHEIGNSFGSSVTPYNFPGASTSTTTRQGFGLNTRWHREEQLHTNDAAAPAADDYGVTIVHRTTGAAQVLTPVAPTGPGQFWTCIIENAADSSDVIGAASVTFATNILNITSNVSAIAQDKAVATLFQSADVGGALKWVGLAQTDAFSH